MTREREREKERTNEPYARCNLKSSSGQRFVSFLLHPPAARATAQIVSRFSGNPPGPYSVGVARTQFDDWSRSDQDEPERPRCLRTEIWYQVSEDAR